MTDETERSAKRRDDRGINRRTVLKGAAAASVAGFVGIPATTGGALGAPTQTGETLYLSDSGFETNDNGGSKLFEVDLDDTNDVANLTLLSNLDAESGGNDWYDQVDALAATPDGSTVYAIDKLTKHLGAYDVSADTFADQGVISNLPNDVVQTAFSPGGTLYVSSDSTDELYEVDPAVPEVSATIDLDDGFDMQGADIVFGADGTLYIFTNGGNSNGAGLYKIDDVSSASQPISPDFVGQPEKPYFTGLAVRDAGAGDLVASTHTYDSTTNANGDGTGSNDVSRLFTIDRGDGTKIAEYDTKLGGSDYYVGYGDMTVGVLDGCDDLTLALCAGQDIDVGTVTVSELAGKLSVTYDLTDPWRLCESHVDIGDLHTNRAGNPQIGTFDLSETHDPCVSSYTYTIECGDDALADVTSDASSLDIATHAVVRPADGCADFASFQPGDSVEGLGTVTPTLDIASTSGVAGAEAVAQQEGETPASYGAPNGSGSTMNGCLDDYHSDPGVAGGFSDLATKNAGASHAYEFTVADDVTLSDFSLRMLDFGDYNPGRDTHHYAEMVAYDAADAEVDRMELEYYTNGGVNPTTAWDTAAHDTVLWSNLQSQGDACDATAGDPGNWVWSVSGDDIVRVELTFGDGHDPNVAFTDLCFTATDETAWTCAGQDGVSRFTPQGSWATHFTYTLCEAPGKLTLDC